MNPLSAIIGHTLFGALLNFIEGPWGGIVGLLSILVSVVIYCLSSGASRKRRIEDRYIRAQERLSDESETIQIDALQTLKDMFDSHKHMRKRIFRSLLNKIKELGEEARAHDKKEIGEEKQLDKRIEYFQKEAKKCGDSDADVLPARARMLRIMAYLFKDEDKQLSMYAQLRAKNKDFRAPMRGFYMSGLKLWGGDMSNVILRKAHLEGIIFIYTHLGADLMDAHLEGADFGNTDLEGAELIDAHLEGAKLSLKHLNNKTLKLAKWKQIRVYPPDSDQEPLRPILKYADYISEAWLERFPFKYWPRN